MAAMRSFVPLNPVSVLQALRTSPCRSDFAGRFRPRITALGLSFAFFAHVAGAEPAPDAASAKPVNPLGKKATELSTANTGTLGTRSTNEPSGGPGHGPAWKTFQHPTGLALSYPPDWQVRELPGALQFVPPDPGSNADGPTEAYVAVAEGAEGIAAADDPRVGAYLDGQLAAIAPFLSRHGAPEKVQAGSTPGVLLQWRGQNPRGLPVAAQAYAAVLKGYGVGLVALGDASRIALREKVLRGIFASLSAGEGERDPQVVGTWRFWSYQASADGKFGTERSRQFVLNADGTCAWSSRAESSGSVTGKDSLGNEVFTGGVAGTSGDQDRGTWSAGKGRLYVTWRDGSLSDWAYQIRSENGARRLWLQGATGKPDEWTEVR